VRIANDEEAKDNIDIFASLLVHKERGGVGVGVGSRGAESFYNQ
jgi:hypothetical protein